MRTYIEIRRHSARHHDEWGHLSDEGVALARRVGESMGDFDTVISSSLPRAAETAIAMGYGINREIHDLAVVGQDVMDEIDWPMEFADFAERMRPGSAIARRGAELVDLLASIATSLKEGGSALLLSHGAVIEMATVAAMPSINYPSWGSHCGHCEGVRLVFSDERFTHASIIRVEGATGR